MLETYRGGNQRVERSGIRIDVVSLVDLQGDLNFIFVPRNGGSCVDVICSVWNVETCSGGRAAHCFRSQLAVIRGQRGFGLEWMKIGRRNGSGPALGMFMELVGEMSQGTRRRRCVTLVFRLRA